MGNIVVHEFITLDGVIDAPTWTFDFGFDPKMGTAIAELMGSRISGGTRLTYTEQGVHFDGLDTVEGREAGTRGLLDNLGTVLARLS